jgi:hypothetical protein
MILYNVDESTFSASEEAWWLHKKGAFYTISSCTNALINEKLLSSECPYE